MSIRSSALLLWGLLCVGCATATGSHGPGSASAVKVDPERLVSDRGAGPVLVGQKIGEGHLGGFESDADYSSLWDHGYFDAVGHRLILIKERELVALMSPQHRVQHLLVGASYRTSAGLGVGSTVRELARAYGAFVLEEQELPRSWIYRPDKVPEPENDWVTFGSLDQTDKKRLQCVGRSSRLAGVDFYFESCEKARSGASVEALVISSADVSDMQPVDPFLNLSTPPPCPAPRTEDPAELTREGHKRLYADRMGDYLAGRSIALGLPMLRDAALSGSTEAGMTYAGVIFTFVHQEVIGDPLDRVLTQGAQEALFFRILKVLRAPEPPPSDSCRAALIDFDTPINDEMFADTDDDGPPTGVCGGQYQFHWLSHADIEGIRQQARAWATCWPRP